MSDAVARWVKRKRRSASRPGHFAIVRKASGFPLPKVDCNVAAYRPQNFHQGRRFRSGAGRVSRLAGDVWGDAPPPRRRSSASRACAVPRADASPRNARWRHAWACCANSSSLKSLIAVMARLCGPRELLLHGATRRGHDNSSPLVPRRHCKCRPGGFRQAHGPR